MTNQDVAGHLLAGLNGDPDQRAATQLLIDAASGVWLAKLSGWAEYLREREDTRVAPGALWIDWDQLRQDLATDTQAWAEFLAWAGSYAGRTATEDEYEQRRAAVPLRPWHGASSSELVILDVALTLAPGGLLGDGLPRLDEPNRAAVLDAFTEVLAGEFHDPTPPPDHTIVPTRPR